MNYFLARNSALLPVYVQNDRVLTNYVYQQNIPSMTQMTACFWFQGETNLINTGTWLSFANSSKWFSGQCICLRTERSLDQIPLPTLILQLHNMLPATTEQIVAEIWHSAQMAMHFLSIESFSFYNFKVLIPRCILILLYHWQLQALKENRPVSWLCRNSGPIGLRG